MRYQPLNIWRDISIPFGQKWRPYILHNAIFKRQVGHSHRTIALWRAVLRHRFRQPSAAIVTSFTQRVFRIDKLPHIQIDSVFGICGQIPAVHLHNQSPNFESNGIYVFGDSLFNPYFPVKPSLSKQRNVNTNHKFWKRDWPCFRQFNDPYGRYEQLFLSHAQ